MSHRIGRALALGLTASALAASPALAQDDPDSDGFLKSLTVQGIQQHLNAFQSHSDLNGGNRAAGGPGFEASADYVKARAQAAGLTVSDHFFDFVYNADRTPPVFTSGGNSYVDGVDFNSMTYSSSGDVTAPISAVDLRMDDIAGKPDSTSTSGCEAADFAGFTPGHIALVQRGSCNFVVKVDLAEAAGAAAVIIMNEGNTPARSVATAGTLGSADQGRPPSIGTTFAIGAQQLSGGTESGPTGRSARVRVDRVEETRTTRNIVAEYRGNGNKKSKESNVVVVGAHLDSVPRGAGINDNGSGSGSILEIAETMAQRNVNPKSTIRFMWYSAEEFGLLGSRAYVDGLSAAERSRIKAMLNFDMVGSPNYVRFVYDGDNSAFPVGPNAAKGPQGSGEIERIFHDHFRSVGLASSETPFSGRSDYGPFIAAGVDIPAGGLFTGAEGTKSAQEAAIYGGTAGEAYDRCYHLACDTLANVNTQGLGEMSDAAGHAAYVLAKRNFADDPLINPSSPVTGSTGTGGGGGLHADHGHDEDVE